MEKMNIVNSYASGSHIKMQKDILNFIPGPLERIIEFGCGLYSTPFLQKKTKQLISYEEDDERKRHALKEYKSDNWTILPFISDYNKFLSAEYVFIDSQTDKNEIVQHFINNGCKIIVAHDTDNLQDCLWHKIKFCGYTCIIYEGAHPDPATSVWTKNEKLVKYLLTKEWYRIFTSYSVFRRKLTINKG